MLLSVLTCMYEAQAGNIETYRERQQATQKLIHKNPAQAKEDLYDLLVQKAEVPDTVFAYTLQLVGVYYWTTNELDSAEYYFKKNIAINKDRPEHRVGNLINLAAVYSESGKLSEAADLLFEALAFYRQFKNVAGMAKCYVDLANVYSYSGVNDQAIQYLLQALELYEQDTVDHERDKALANFNLANSFTSQKDYEFALERYNNALPVLKKDFGMLTYCIGLLTRSYVLSQINKGAEALETTDSVIATINTTEAFSYLMGYAQMNKGVALKSLARNDQAIESFRTAFSEALVAEDEVLLITTEYVSFLNGVGKFAEADQAIKRFEETTFEQDERLVDRLRYEEVKLQTLEALGEEAKQLATLKKIVLLKDSLSGLYDQFVVKELHERYKSEIIDGERQLAQAKVELLEKNNAQNRLWIAISLLLFTIATGIGIYLWYTKRLKHRLSVLELQRLNDEKRGLEKEARLQEENLKLRESVIEKQKQELLATAMEVNSIRENIRRILSEQKDETDAKRLQKSISTLVRDQTFTERLLDKFKSIDPNFINQLSKQFPDLTGSELEFCSLLKLGLHNKEIAHILQISHDSVIKKRYRMAQKLRGSDGMEVDEVLRNIDRP